MSGNFPVRHVRGFGLKWNQVQRGLRGGTLAWADEAHTEVRDTTLAESMAIQEEQARLREPLVAAELPGLKFEPPVSGIEMYRAGRRMVLDATAICAGFYHPSAA